MSAKTYLLILEMVILTAENQKERHFFQRDSIHILVSYTVKTRKFRLLYFGNETCYGTGNFCKDIYVYILFIFNPV